MRGTLTGTGCLIHSVDFGRVGLRDLTTILWKRRWLVLLVLVVSIGFSAYFAQVRAPVYESTATIAVTPNADRLQVPTGEDPLSTLLGTYAQIAVSGDNIDAASRLAGHPVDPSAITTSTEPGTGILRVSARDTVPQRAVKTARSVASALKEATSDNRVLITSVVGPPALPDTPVQPRPPLIIAVGTLIGATLAVMLALLVEQFRRRIEGPADVAAISDVAVIGRLPRERKLARRDAGVVWESPKMLGMQESLRALRTNLEFLTESRRAVIQVTSAVAEEGKSTLVANLGVAFGQLGVVTTVVDCDLRRPRQHELLTVPNDRGVSNMLAVPDAPLRPQPTRFSSLSLVPSGPLPPNATELLHVRFQRIVEELRQSGSLVLIDSPPLLPVSDARLMAPHVDGVVVIISAGARRPAELRSALEKLELGSARILGIVLNRSGELAEGVGSYGYYYQGSVDSRISTEDGRDGATARRGAAKSI